MCITVDNVKESESNTDQQSPSPVGITSLHLTLNI